MLISEEWNVLSRLPPERLRRICRFLARHYYRERIVRLFRYVRMLASMTGRDPLRVLDMPAALPALDGAILGSLVTAERILALIEPFLLENDASIVERLPYWRELVQYQAALFRVEAEFGRFSTRMANPYRLPSARILELQWDLPSILRHLREGRIGAFEECWKATRLLIAHSRQGFVTAVRCSREILALLEAADGQHDIEELSVLSGLPVYQAERLLRRLREIGAIG